MLSPPFSSLEIMTRNPSFSRRIERIHSDWAHAQMDRRAAVVCQMRTLGPLSPEAYLQALPQGTSMAMIRDILARELTSCW